MYRREFLKMATGASVALGLGNHALAQRGIRPRVYFDQSGVIGEPPFVAAVMVCDDASSALKQIAAIRRSNEYMKALTYRSCSRRKLRYAVAMLDWWLARRDVRIYVRAIQKQKKLIQDPLWSYIEQYRLLCGQALRQGGQFQVVTQRRFLGPRQIALQKRLQKTIPEIESIATIAEKQDDIIQFLGLVIGCIYADNADSQRPSNVTKVALVGELKKRLKTDSLWKLSRRDQFRLDIVGRI